MQLTLKPHAFERNMVEIWSDDTPWALVPMVCFRDYDGDIYDRLYVNQEEVVVNLAIEEDVE